MLFRSNTISSQGKESSWNIEDSYSTSIAHFGPRKDAYNRFVEDMGGLVSRSCEMCGFKSPIDLKAHDVDELKVEYGAKPPIDDTAQREMVEQLPDPRIQSFEAQAKSNFHDTYTLDRELGEGAFATVIECHKTSTPKKKFAVKRTDRLNLNAKTLYCTLMGPYLLKRIYHPNIMRYHDFYKDDRYYYFICEELKGGPLIEGLKESQHYNERMICRLVFKLLSGLEYLHARNIVHRDLKMDNLMLTRADSETEEQLNLKIVDFGFAEELTESRPKLKLILGTPGWSMSCDEGRSLNLTHALFH